MLAGVGIREEIFPTERREAYVQTEWSRGWGYAGIGYREAARLLTKEKLTFGPSVDQTGLAIFFLQRHRVELALKELLTARGDGERAIKLQHSLARLWDACRELVGADTVEWQEMDPGSELIAVLADADPNSYTFRYPVDTRGKEIKRPQFIDLDALGEHVDFVLHIASWHQTAALDVGPVDARQACVRVSTVWASSSRMRGSHAASPRIPATSSPTKGLFFRRGTEHTWVE